MLRRRAEHFGKTTPIAHWVFQLGMTLILTYSTHPITFVSKLVIWGMLGFGNHANELLYDFFDKTPNCVSVRLIHSISLLDQLSSLSNKNLTMMNIFFTHSNKASRDHKLSMIYFMLFSLMLKLIFPSLELVVEN